MVFHKLLLFLLAFSQSVVCLSYLVYYPDLQFYPPQAPHCLQEPTLNAALTLALTSPLDDVRSNAELVRELLKTHTKLGGLNHQGKDLFEEVKKVRIGTVNE